MCVCLSIYCLCGCVYTCILILYVQYTYNHPRMRSISTSKLVILATVSSPKSSWDLWVCQGDRDRPQIGLFLNVFSGQRHIDDVWWLTMGSMGRWGTVHQCPMFERTDFWRDQWEINDLTCGTLKRKPHGVWPGCQNALVRSWRHPNIQN